MSLSKVRTVKPAAPYEKLPPLHIQVLSITDQKRTLSWQFTEAGEARPALTKVNTVVAITDGTTVAKITLFENLANKITTCGGYIMKNYSIKGDVPPYQIYVTKNTVFYNTVPIDVAENLRAEAQLLVSPPSKMTRLGCVREVDGLMSTEGMVVEVTPVRKVQSGRDMVPLCTITLKEDTTHVQVNLWREAVLLPLRKGAVMKFTHLKGQVSSYGFHLQTTGFTTSEEVITSEVVSALGVVQHPEKQGVLKLLASKDDLDPIDYEINESIWQPLSKRMVKLPFFIKIKCTGLTIQEAEVAEDTEE